MTRAGKGLALACASVLAAGGAATAFGAELVAIDIAGDAVQGSTLSATVTERSPSTSLPPGNEPGSCMVVGVTI